MLYHQFLSSPGASVSIPEFNALFANLGHDAAFTSTDYQTGSPAALGNYVAQALIDFGHQDGANEENGYLNRVYQPVNPALVTKFPGNPDLVDANRWQPLRLNIFIDQSGNPIPGTTTPEFLSPEWGAVTPFALMGYARTIINSNVA